MFQSKLKTPYGVRDFLPYEAARKREIEGKIRDIFVRWGYSEVMTPTFEYVDLLSLGIGEDLQKMLYRFIDFEGGLLALRPEMTTPIARVVSTRLRDTAPPHRLYYFANVFRYDDPQAGHRREFHQAGVELIGSSSLKADTEVIALAAESLKSTGLKDFQIDISHVGFLKGLISVERLGEELAQKVRHALYKKDYVALRKDLDQAEIEPGLKRVILDLESFRGGEELLERAEKAVPGEAAEALNALESLRKIYRALVAYGLGAHINIDLGMMKDFDYYTGTIFEGYTGEIGYGLCSGGRYDRLLAEFGYDCPATGVAIGMERLIAALERQDGRHEACRFSLQPPYIGVFDGDSMQDALKIMGDLRAKGIRIEWEVTDEPLDAVISRAKKKGNPGIILFGADSGEGMARYMEPESGKDLKVKYDDLFDILKVCP